VAKQDGAKGWLKKHGREFMEEFQRAPNFSDIPLEVIEPYARMDAELTLKLYHLFWPHIAEDEGLLKTYKAEMTLLREIIVMEQRGVAMDVPFMEQRARELVVSQEQSKKTLMKMAPPLRIAERTLPSRLSTSVG